MKWIVHTEHRQFPYRLKSSAELCAQRFVELNVSPIVRIERCERIGVCEEVYRWDQPTAGAAEAGGGEG